MDDKEPVFLKSLPPFDESQLSKKMPPPKPVPTSTGSRIADETGPVFLKKLPAQPVPRPATSRLTDDTEPIFLQKIPPFQSPLQPNPLPVHSTAPVPRPAASRITDEDEAAFLKTLLKPIPPDPVPRPAPAMSKTTNETELRFLQKIPPIGFSPQPNPLPAHSTAPVPRPAASRITDESEAAFLKTLLTPIPLEPVPRPAPAVSRITDDIEPVFLKKMPPIDFPFQPNARPAVSTATVPRPAVLRSTDNAEPVFLKKIPPFEFTVRPPTPEVPKTRPGSSIKSLQKPARTPAVSRITDDAEPVFLKKIPPIEFPIRPPTPAVPKTRAGPPIKSLQKIPTQPVPTPAVSKLTEETEPIFLQPIPPFDFELRCRPPTPAMPKTTNETPIKSLQKIPPQPVPTPAVSKLTDEDEAAFLKTLLKPIPPFDYSFESRPRANPPPAVSTAPDISTSHGSITASPTTRSSPTHRRRSHDGQAVLSTGPGVASKPRKIQYHNPYAPLKSSNLRFSTHISPGPSKSHPAPVSAPIDQLTRNQRSFILRPPSPKKRPVFATPSNTTAEPPQPVFYGKARLVDVTGPNKSSSHSVSAPSPAPAIPPRSSRRPTVLPQPPSRIPSVPGTNRDLSSGPAGVSRNHTRRHSVLDLNQSRNPSVPTASRNVSSGPAVRSQSDTRRQYVLDQNRSNSSRSSRPATFPENHTRSQPVLGRNRRDISPRPAVPVQNHTSRLPVPGGNRHISSRPAVVSRNHSGSRPVLGGNRNIFSQPAVSYGRQNSSSASGTSSSISSNRPVASSPQSQIRRQSIVEENRDIPLPFAVSSSRQNSSSASETNSSISSTRAVASASGTSSSISSNRAVASSSQSQTRRQSIVEENRDIPSRTAALSSRQSHPLAPGRISRTSSNCQGDARRRFGFYGGNRDVPLQPAVSSSHQNPSSAPGRNLNISSNADVSQDHTRRRYGFYGGDRDIPSKPAVSSNCQDLPSLPSSFRDFFGEKDRPFSWEHDTVPGMITGPDGLPRKPYITIEDGQMVRSYFPHIDDILGTPGPRRTFRAPLFEEVDESDFPDTEQVSSPRSVPAEHHQSSCPDTEETGDQNRPSLKRCGAILRRDRPRRARAGHDESGGEEEDDGEEVPEAKMEEYRGRLRALAQDSEHHPVDSSIISPMIANNRDRRRREEEREREKKEKEKEKEKKKREAEFMAKMARMGFVDDKEASASQDFLATSPPPQRQIPDRSNVNGTNEEHDVICAVSESGNGKVVGVTTIDMSLGKATIGRVVIDDGYKTLVETIWRMQHRPQTFVLLKKILAFDKSKLAETLRGQFPDGNFVAWDRENWRENLGMALLDKYAEKGDKLALKTSLEGNYYATCSWSAAMSYVDLTSRLRFLRETLHVVYSEPADVMGLDRAAVSSLELLQTSRGARAGPTTLFGILNQTMTPQGRRLLRTTILQPSTSKELLTKRWNTVHELTSSQDFFNDVRASLQKLQRIDVEQIMGQMTKASRNPRKPIHPDVTSFHGFTRIIFATHDELYGAERDLNHILMIKAYLKGVKSLHETLDAAGCKSWFCERAKRKSGPRYTTPVLNQIRKGIYEDASFSNRPVDIKNNRLWAVKSAPDNCNLRLARNSYKFRTNEMKRYHERVCAHFEKMIGCKPDLVLGTDNNYRFKFQWSDIEKETRRCVDKYGLIRRLARIKVIHAERKNKQFFFQTKDLVKRSNDVQYWADEATQQSDQKVVDIKMALLKHFSFIRAIAEAVADLDILCSFAHLSTTQNYVRPIFSRTLTLQNARHPVVEMRKKNYVGNEVLFGDQGLRFMVVTGSNMSGKSTYIKSVALIQILAQMGCFVPASSASLPVCDRVFTRLSTEDKPNDNLGTFMVELQEMAAILKLSTEKSLVVIDELGRGTSTNEGKAIAFLASKELVRKHPRVLFATHYTDMGEALSVDFPDHILSVHLEAQTDTVNGTTPRISLSHKLANGPVRDQDYGINLARRHLPQTVIKNAQKISDWLEARNPTTKKAPMTRADKLRQMEGAFASAIRQVFRTKMDKDALKKFVLGLRKELTYTIVHAKDDEGCGKTRSDADIPVRPVLPVLEKMPQEERDKWTHKRKVAEKRINLEWNRSIERQSEHYQQQKRRRSQSRVNQKRKAGEEGPVDDGQDVRVTKKRRVGEGEAQVVNDNMTENQTEEQHEKENEIVVPAKPTDKENENETQVPAKPTDKGKEKETQTPEKQIENETPPKTLMSAYRRLVRSRLGEEESSSPTRYANNMEKFYARASSASQE